ncbi:hypothetical protein PF008_g699 [Phytophthora fragariae]|uniref:Uncharacterized protein n=1 Tax=Phytophthora fragariae TaxID=53985 RepID=A0A6G0SM87_9STRA|nr:hypothetical protein PF008_g699 [Phytophthora fragariae]
MGRKHPAFEEEMLEAATGEIRSLLNYVQRASHSLYGVAALFSLHHPVSICVETLQARMEGAVLAVESPAASEMPVVFGLILDGWTHWSVELYVFNDPKLIEHLDKEDDNITDLILSPACLLIRTGLAREQAVAVEECQLTQ